MGNRFFCKHKAPKLTIEGRELKEFSRRVYQYLVNNTHKGQVVTYGQIATALGHPRAARAVGSSLHASPTPVVVPCHRVVNAKGCLTKCFAHGGIEIQRQLLEAEGVEVVDYCVDLSKYRARN